MVASLPWLQFLLARTLLLLWEIIERPSSYMPSLSLLISKNIKTVYRAVERNDYGKD
jgi:hypothetical protein